MNSGSKKRWNEMEPHHSEGFQGPKNGTRMPHVVHWPLFLQRRGVTIPLSAELHENFPLFMQLFIELRATAIKLRNL